MNAEPHIVTDHRYTCPTADLVFRQFKGDKFCIACQAPLVNAPRLPGGTHVRLNDTGQTGQLAPYSPGDGEKYNVILDELNNTGSRLAPMLRISQFDVVRPEPNDLTKAIISIALAGVENRQRQEPPTDGYDDGEPFAGADDPDYRAAKLRGRLE